MPEPTPPRPPDWDKTIADLMNEMDAGLRKGIRPHELDWAREYSRSLIPDGLRSPQLGDLYESLVDQNIGYMTAWYVPFTGGGDGPILAGERVWLDSDPGEDKPICVYAMPIDYDTLEQRMVPAEDRKDPNYSNFYLCIDTKVLLEKFKLVATGYQQASLR